MTCAHDPIMVVPAHLVRYKYGCESVPETVSDMEDYCELCGLENAAVSRTVKAVIPEFEDNHD